MKTKEYVLLKDIVIPAGTRFTPGPSQTRYYGTGHYECTVGLSKDSSGSLVYHIEDDLKNLTEHFSEIK